MHLVGAQECGCKPHSPHHVWATYFHNVCRVRNGFAECTHSHKQFSTCLVGGKGRAHSLLLCAFECTFHNVQIGLNKNLWISQRSVFLMLHIRTDCFNNNYLHEEENMSVYSPQNVFQKTAGLGLEGSSAGPVMKALINKSPVRDTRNRHKHIFLAALGSATHSTKAFFNPFLDCRLWMRKAVKQGCLSVWNFHPRKQR